MSTRGWAQGSETSGSESSSSRNGQGFLFWGDLLPFHTHSDVTLRDKAHLDPQNGEQRGPGHRARESLPSLALSTWMERDGKRIGNFYR